MMGIGFEFARRVATAYGQAAGVHAIWRLLLLGALLARIASTLGQEISTAAADKALEKPIVIQSIPAGELARFLTNERPVRRSVFEQFLKSRQSIPHTDRDFPSDLQIPRAFYEAHFSPEGALEGTARIEFASRSPLRAVCPMPDLRLSLSKIRWKDRDDPVIWGVAPDQRVVLVVPQSGVLEFDWSCQAELVGRDAFNFRMGLVRAGQAEFVLSTNGRWRATLAGNAPFTETTDGADQIRRHFHLGAAREARIRLESQPPKAIASPEYWVRMHSRYDVGRQGLDLVADLELELSGAPQTTLPLRLDKSLQLVSAKLGEQDLSWSTRENSPDQALELRFDPPLTESGRKIRLEARAALPGAALASASLPQIHPPESAVRESEIELNIAPPLELAGIELQGARMIDNGSVVSPRGVESRRFRLYSASADVRCTFRAPEFQGKVRYAAQVDLNDATWEIAATYQIQVESGERFDISTMIPPGWVVDSVESTPAGAIENWTASSEPTQQRLSLRLQSALTAKTPLRLSVTAHMPLAGGESVSSQQFLLANFDSMKLEMGLLQIRSAPGIRIDASGEAKRLNPATLEPGDQEMIGSGATAPLYSLSATEAFQITRSVSGAEFRVTTTSRVLLEEKRAANQHRITITPQRQQLDRLLVLLQPPTGDDVYFDLDQSSSHRVSANLVKSSPEGDLWQLRFPEPIGGEFTVAAMETHALAEKGRLRTLRCLEAASQDSSLRVFADSHRPWDLTTSGVQPIYGGGGAVSPLLELASYRYSLSDSPVIEVLRKDIGPARDSLWAWTEDRVTCAGNEAEEFYSSELVVETAAAANAQFHIPADSRLVEVRLNRQPIQSIRLSGTTLVVDIPGSSFEQRLQIRVAARRERSLFGISPLTWKGVTPTFPSLSKTWRLFAPRDVAIASTQFRMAPQGCVSLFVRQELDSHAANTEQLSAAHASAESESWFNENQLQALGWSSTPIGIRSPEAPTLVRFSSSSWRLLGWCAAVVFLVAAYSLLQIRFGRFRVAAAIVFFAVAGGSCLPPPYSFLFSGALLGTVLALLTRSFANLGNNAWIRGRSAAIPYPSLATALLAFAIANSVGWGRHAAAQNAPEPKGSDPERRVRNVFEPVDQDGKPTGDFVYVSPDLFEELAFTDLSDAAEPCILREVHYRISRSAMLPAESMVITAEYLYFANADSQLIPLLYDAQAATLDEQTVFVNGERRVLPKSMEDRPHQVELLGRGLHTLRLNLRIPLKPEKDHLVASWRSLGVPKQDLEIETDAPTRWMLNDREIKHDPVTRSAKVTLAPQRDVKLSIHRAPLSSPANETLMSHLAWISVSPGAVAYEHLVRIEPESPANSIVFELDEGISLDSVVGDNRQIINPTVLGDRRFRAPLNSPIDESAEIRIHCSKKSGLDLDRLASTGILFDDAKMVATQIAVSAPAEYAIRSDARPGVNALSAAEFMRSWAQAKTPPRLAFSVDPDKSWSVEVHPLAPTAQVNLQTECLLHRSELQVQWSAEITSAGEPTSFYSFRVPAAFKIESISAHEGSTNRLARYSRSGADRISLFMRTASSEPRRVRLRGSIPLEEGRPFLLPALAIENAAISAQVLKIFRSDDAIVELKPTKGLRAVESAASQEAMKSTILPDESRFLGAFEAPAAPAPWEAPVVVAANSLKSSHQSVARFETRDAKWRLEQQFQLSIQSGLVDELVFELPPALREPLEIEPNEPFRVIRNAEEAPQLVIRPKQPWKDAHELKIRADYNSANGAGDLTLLPLRLLNSEFQAGWIAAPKQTGTGGFVWTGEESDESAPPPASSNAGDFQWFKLRTAKAAVRLQNAAADSRPTSTRLEGMVEVDDQEFSAVLTWTWGGVSAREVSLTAPEGLQILRARVTGSTARIRQVSEQRWILSSALGSAPPTLEVVCRGRFSPGNVLPLPQIEGVDTTESLLTVACRRQFGLAQNLQILSLPSNAGILARLRLLDHARREAQTVLPTLGEQESLNWRRNWLARWDSARAKSPFSNEPGESLHPAGALWLEEAEAARSRFVAEIESASKEPGPANLNPLESLAKADTPDDRQVFYCYAKGSPLPIQLESRDSWTLARESLQNTVEADPWWLLAMAIGLLSCFLVAGSRNLRSLLLSAAPALGWIALGVLWWLWFSPIWFGPTLASAALILMGVRKVRQWGKRPANGLAR